MKHCYCLPYCSGQRACKCICDSCSATRGPTVQCRQFLCLPERNPDHYDEKGRHYDIANPEPRVEGHYNPENHPDNAPSQPPKASLLAGGDTILTIVFKYREACEAVQVAWADMLCTPVSSVERVDAHTKLRACMQKARDLRTSLLEHALGGRSEVPR